MLLSESLSRPAATFEMAEVQKGERERQGPVDNLIMWTICSYPAFGYLISPKALYTVYKVFDITYLSIYPCEMKYFKKKKKVKLILNWSKKKKKKAYIYTPVNHLIHN